MRDTIPILIDDAAASGDPALLAAACLEHPGAVLIPTAAADALHGIAARGGSTASAGERRLVEHAANLLRKIEAAAGRDPWEVA